MYKKDSEFAIWRHNPNKIKERFTLNHRSLLRTLRVRKIQKGVQKQAVYPVPGVQYPGKLKKNTKPLTLTSGLDPGTKRNVNDIDS